MSEFSQYCKQLLLESGSNVYRFSNTYHLDHTTLQRMITGKRLPSQEFVEKFCSHLRMTPQEKDLLWELFEMEQVGKSRYENRVFIRQMLEYIGNLQQRTTLIPFNVSAASLTPNTSSICTTNPMDTCSQMTKVIMRENYSSSPLFYTNIPVTCSHFMTELKRTVGTHIPEARIVHFLILHKNPDTYTDSNYNLGILKEILPLALLDDTGYSAHYCYSSSLHQAATASLIYPYYLITSTQVMLLSCDHTRAVIYTDHEIVKHYTAEFQHLLSMASPLVSKSFSLDQIMESYETQCRSHSKIRFTFDCFPCLARSFDLDMLQAHLRPAITFPDNQLLILKNLADFLDKSGNLIAFLPINGLRHFYETGELCDKYNDILFPLTPEERKEVLERLICLCENGEYNLYLLPDHYLPNLPQLNIEVYDNSRLFMFPMSSQNVFSFFWMEESSIYDAFFDYFNSLKNRKDIIHPNEVPSIITELLCTAPNTLS